MQQQLRSNVSNPAKVIVPLGIALALSLLGDLALFASLPINVESVGVSLANLGLIFGIHRLIRIPGNPLVGFLLNGKRRRPFFLLGMVLAFLSTLGYGIVHGLTWLILTRICWGVAWMLIYISSMAMLIDITDEDNRGKWTGVYNTWYLVGIAGGSLLGGVLSDKIGYQYAMIVCAGLTLVGFITIAKCLPETLVSEKRTSKNHSLIIDIKLDQKLIIWGKMILNLIFGTPGLLAVLLIYMINQFAAEGVALSVMSILLKERFGAGIALFGTFWGITSLNGFILALRYLLSAAISPFIGRVSDKKVNGRRMLLIVGLVTSIISFLFIGYSTDLIWILVGIILNALSGAGVFVSLGAMLGDISKNEDKGKMLGFYAMAGDIGSAFGPISAYFMLSFTQVSSVFFGCGLLFLVGLIFVLSKK